jgi:hypothetical protein
MSQIQALSLGDRDDLFKFQEHQWICLPPVLQGKNPQTVDAQQTEAKGAKESRPSGKKDQRKIREVGTSELGVEGPQKQE